MTALYWACSEGKRTHTLHRDAADVSPGTSQHRPAQPWPAAHWLDIQTHTAQSDTPYMLKVSHMHQLHLTDNFFKLLPEVKKVFYDKLYAQNCYTVPLYKVFSQLLAQCLVIWSTNLTVLCHLHGCQFYSQQL